MIEIGKINKLHIAKKVDFGVYLEGGNLGEILLPSRYVPKEFEIGDEMEVFIYRDSEDRLIATTDTPFCEVGQCAFLKVTSTSSFGAFLDWGLPKDLLVPFKEQLIPMVVGNSYAVHLYIDVTGRIAASSKLSDYLKEECGNDFSHNQEVNLLIARQNEFGYKAVINDEHMGLIHNIDLLQPINVGERMCGYIKNIREDGKVDLILHSQSGEAIDELSEEILEYIKEEGGKINITDKSPPEIIHHLFAVSKSSYKKALGNLYKKKLILLTKEEITLV